MIGIYTLALIWQLVLMCQLPLGGAMSISMSIAPTQQQQQQQSIGDTSHNISTSIIDPATDQKKNTTSVAASLAVATSATVSATPSVTLSVTIESSPSTIKHIRRRKRETRVDIPFDFHTKHLFCDVDVQNVHHIIDNMYSVCNWAYNGRWSHEGFWRVWQIYRLEAFMFGQYAERLKRYELDPHGYVWPKGQ
ncbi:uncharacterized protein LOC111077569 isoform X1 [Drosophila obscura]|uniref:uncharacterized protein LOC111077569 isoform X1 n=1 Tax=Drosophila obscura TaxID=7282 RepID=UPI001BB1BF8B|nr:uncharacterized protein LOC111077569 isoform X1 [Drosophila obscura]